MKKIIVSDDIVEKIIYDYNNTYLGSPALSEKYKIPKHVIIRILKENNCNVGSSGRKFKGGKKEADKRYYKKYKGKIQKYYKEWSEKNRNKLRDYHKEWRTNNDNYKKYKRDNEKELKKENPRYKLVSYFRTALNTIIRENNLTKYDNYFNILGYSQEDLLNHIETLFLSGMTWENYGEWHIDHIKPISRFKFTDVNDDEFKECWSLSNLQPLWAFDNLSKNNKIIAHQYKIRENKRRTENINFNINEVSLSNCRVDFIDRKTCKKIVEEYEWLGYLPQYTKYHFGIYFRVGDEEILGGVIAYQPEYGENLGVWDKYGYTGKIIQLSRGVCLWWTPKNTASYFITKTLKWLKDNTKYKVITATVDSSAGEIGTIYQSLNWYYVGTFGGNLTNTGKERIRYGYIINGKIYNQRHIRKKLGTAKRDVVLEHFKDVQIVNLGRKKRYFYFIGNKRENKKLLSGIKQIIKPYPKR